jgi:hypothetical protein
VECFLSKRHVGTSRQQAYHVFQGKITLRHTFNLEKSFSNHVKQMQAVFPQIGKIELTGLDWLYHVFDKKVSHPILKANQFCLKNQVNCIFFSRSNIILFKPDKSNTIISLNNSGYKKDLFMLDSS